MTILAVIKLFSFKKHLEICQDLPRENSQDHVALKQIYSLTLIITAQVLLPIQAL